MRPQVKSPCIKICVLNNENVCVGCFRTLEEIGLWSSFSDEDRSEVLCRLACQGHAPADIERTIDFDG